MLLAGTIFILTLVLVIWQPRGLGIGWSAAFGAALALATGGVQVADIPELALNGALSCSVRSLRILWESFFDFSIK